MDELKLIERLLDVLNDWDLNCSEEPELKLEIARQQAKVVKLLAAPAVSKSVCGIRMDKSECERYLQVKSCKHCPWEQTVC